MLKRMKSDYRRLSLWLAATGATLLCSYLIASASSGHKTPFYPYWIFVVMMIIGGAAYSYSPARTRLTLWRSSIRRSRMQYKLETQVKSNDTTSRQSGAADNHVGQQMSSSTRDNESTREDYRASCWDASSPFVLYQLGSQTDWALLARRYLRDPIIKASAETIANISRSHITTDSALLRCLAIAQANNARTAVIEFRHIDDNYKSEHEAFYSKLFERFGDATDRIHFFACQLDVEDVLRLPPESGYLGYITIRPRMRASVGHTMLKPPPDQQHIVRTAVRETVGFFGQTLAVRAVPFMQPDGRLSGSAQTAAWICHYSAYLQGDRCVSNRTIASICAAGSGVRGSTGVTELSCGELAETLSKSGLPPTVIALDNLGSEDLIPEMRKPGLAPTREAADAAVRFFSRYLNSCAPVIAILSEQDPKTEFEHSWAVVVCGYSETNNISANGLSISDPQLGPYIQVKDILHDSNLITGKRRNWKASLAPVPRGMWLDSRVAERFGAAVLVAAGRRATSATEASARIGELIRACELGIRTYFSTSQRFKERLGSINADPVVIREYRLAAMPAYIWITELIDHATARTSAPNVVGQIIMDATSSENDVNTLIGLLAWLSVEF